MFRHLTRELARTQRLGAEVSLLVLDLNGFKDINDTYGHHAGDRALREVANVLRATIRPYDVCARYAGDEFVIVLAGCNREEAENKRRELQRGCRADRVRAHARPGRCRCRSAPGPPCSRMTAIRTKCCWQPPTGVCIRNKADRRRETPRHHEPVMKALSGSVYDITPV